MDIIWIRRWVLIPDFERADSIRDNRWFSAHWDLLKVNMMQHSLATYHEEQAFNWNGFRSWLEEQGHRDELGERYCDKFMRADMFRYLYEPSADVTVVLLHE